MGGDKDIEQIADGEPVADDETTDQIRDAEKPKRQQDVSPQKANLK